MHVARSILPGRRRSSLEELSSCWNYWPIRKSGLMMLFAGSIGRFVSVHPTVKMLALAFLVLIGVVLVAEGFGHHLPKGYIHSAMAFATLSELLNIRMRKRAARPVRLHEPYLKADQLDWPDVGERCRCEAPTFSPGKSIFLFLRTNHPSLFAF
jgi:hypothetical protein